MKTIYEFSKRNEVDKLFRHYFNVSISSFYDPLISIFSKRIVIDIIKFDNWLHDQIGDYELKNESMNSILIKKYGENARNLIENLI